MIPYGSVIDAVEERMRLQSKGELPAVDWSEISREERSEQEYIAIGWVDMALIMSNYFSIVDLKEPRMLLTRKIGFEHTPVTAEINRSWIKVSRSKRRAVYTATVNYHGYIGPSVYNQPGDMIEIEPDSTSDSYEDVFDAITFLYQEIHEFEKKTKKVGDITSPLRIIIREEKKEEPQQQKKQTEQEVFDQEKD